MRRLALFAVLLCPALAWALPAAAPRAARGEEAIADRLLVHHREGAAARLAARHGVTHLRALGPGLSLLTLADPATRAAVAAALAADPEIDWVEPDRIRRAHGTPTTNDPLFSQQWSLPLTRVPDAWSRSRGSAAVVVAILDTGTTAHPELADRWLPGFDFISSPDNGGDGDGRDGDPSDAGSLDPESSGLHGTHVAGIVGAHSDNQLGIAGIDWSCRLLPVRVLGVDGASGADSDIADAIRWSVGLHVDGVPDNTFPAAIINLSFGGAGTSLTLQAAIDDAGAQGAIVIASAGNDGADTAGYAPAGLDHVIAVGASNHNGQLADYSNRGARLDLLAPGGELDGGVGGILSTLELADGSFGYALLAGTSQAAPHVTGVAALMRALDPTLDAERARAILTASADPRSQCLDGCGGGLLDADAALAAVESACADGHCVAPAPRATTLGSGCAIGPGRGGSPLFALVFLALLFTRRPRRARG